MSPVADDHTTPAPTKGKVKKPIKRSPIIGPTAPTSIGPIAPSKLPPAPAPARSPRATQPTQATAPSYVTDILTRKQPLRVADTSRFKAEEDSSSITETIYNFKNRDLNADSKIVSDPDTNLTEFLQGAMRKDFTPDPVEQRNPLLVDGLDSYGDSNTQELQAFLKKVQPARPENYDPEYGGLVMPERWKHQGKSLKNPLKPFWDQDFITKFLGVGTEYDPETAFGRSQIKSNMNDIMYKQLQTQSNWMRQRTIDRANRVRKFLDQAGEDAFEGDFTTLADKLEKNPNFLEFAKYRDDFTKGPADIWTEWFDKRVGIADPYLRNAYRNEAKNKARHLDYIKKNYKTARSIVKSAIDRYEEQYNDSVEFQDVEDAGPAIPDVKAIQEKKAAQQQKLSDLVGEQGNNQQALSEFYGGDTQAIIKAQRASAKNHLGVTELPKVKEMLATLVANGQVDPENPAEIEAWIRRLKNPNHPDTRAMYVAFARTVNKDLDVKGDALDYINEPIKQYMKDEQSRAEGNAKAEAEAETKRREEDDFVLFAGGLAGGSAPVPDQDKMYESAKANQTEDTKDMVSGMEWTFDKLSRLNYAVSGTAGAMYSLDKDPVKDKPWYVDTLRGITDPVSIFTGRSWYDSMDEIRADPGKLKDVGQEGYSQLFRGSGFKGVNDVVPSTFSRVIAENALTDEQDNIYDASWYQHVAGFALDVGTDPLNFVGVGVIDDTLKVPVKAAGLFRKADKAEDTFNTADWLKELNNPNLGPAAEKAWRVQQVQAMLGDEIELAGVQLVKDSDATVPFAVQYTNDEPSYLTRAQRKTKPAGRAPEISYDPAFDLETINAKQAIADQRAELTALRRSVSEQMGMSHYTSELNKLADEMDMASVTMPQLSVQKLMARTSRPINQTGVSQAAVALNAPGRLFYEKVIARLEDLVGPMTKWEGRSSRTKFATVKDQDGTRLTGKAANAKRAMDEEEAVYQYATARGLDPNDLVDEATRARWDKALDEAGNTDELTGKPNMYEEYDVDSYIDAGAPGLLDGSFDPYEAFASASGDAAMFKRTFSQADVLKALHHGPKLHAASDAAAAESLRVGRGRIQDAMRKLKSTTDPKVREATYKDLALGTEMVSQHTLAGAFRYLDTLQTRRGAVGEQHINNEAIEHLDSLISRADDALTAPLDATPRILKNDEGIVGGDLWDNVSFGTKDNTYTEADDLTPYLGGESVDSYGNKTAYFSGTYEDFDFTGLDFEKALALNKGSFSSPSAKIQSMIDELQAQKVALKNESAGVPNALNPVEATQVNRLLGPNSQFRKADGSINTDKVSKHLKHNKEDFNDKGMFKVRYELAKPKAAEGTVEHARYTREVQFLARVADFVEDRANMLFREEKTKLVKEQAVPEDLSDDLSTFWTVLDGRKAGPAERKLGPRPSAESFRKKYPNYTERQITDPKSKKAPQSFKDVEQVPTLKGQRIQENPLDDVTQAKVTYGVSTPAKTAKQRKLEALFKGEKRRWDAAVLRAREIDNAEWKKLNASRKTAVEGFRLTAKQNLGVYQTAYRRAIEEVTQDLNAGIVKATNANATLSFGDQAKSLERQISNELKHRELQLKIQEAEATNVETLRNIAEQRKVLAKQRRDLYKRVKTIKHEANAVKATMKVRITEEHILQAMQMPERITGRMLQLRMMGMRKNLQFTHNMFNSMQAVEKMMPATVYTNFANNWVRPSKQFDQAESIALRARWEGKTPVVIRANLEKLNRAMANTSESERSGMLMAIRKNIPYGGPKQVEYHAVKGILDDMMRIVNGNHEQYVFQGIGKVKAEALTVGEISRFLPKEYALNHSAFFKLANKRGPGPMNKDPFSAMPDANTNATLDDLMNSIEVNGVANPKDLNDPFRLAWVYSLAADQAAQLRGFKKTIAETFGVIKPTNPEKVKIWKELANKAEWRGHVDFQDAFNGGVEVYFPPEIADELDKLMKVTQPGPESWEISKLFDQAIGYWKQGMTIYNPAYYTRNGIGEIMASWLDGVNSPKWYRMAHQVHRFEKKSGQELSELIKKFDGLKGKVADDSVKGNEVLFTLKGGEKVRVEDALMWYVEMGLKSTFVNTDLSRGVRGLASANLSKNPVRKAGSKVNETVHEAGEGFEDWLRMSHFLHAMQNSGKGTLREAAGYAAQRVTRSHFDYTDFSQMEKTYMLRAFPFYKWVRRGAPLMLAHLFMTPGKMVALPKALDTISGLGIDPLNVFNDDPIMSTSDVLEDKNGHLPDYQGIAPAWVRDLFAYQMQPAEDDEYVNYLRINTPQIDGLSGLLSFSSGNLGDSTAGTLLNPAIKMPLELGMNRGIDPDSNFEIYGGDYNENMGINDAEAIGAYSARNLNPIAGFLAKLSKNGKLPVGNITYQESGRDATRDVASFISGLGFYQAKQPKNIETVTSTGDTDNTSPAVGSLGLENIPQFRGGPAASKVSSKKQSDQLKSIDKLIDNLKGSSEDFSGKGWIDFPDRKGKGWIDYPDRKWKNYGSGGFGGSSNWDLIELLQQLREQIKTGRVIDLEGFDLDA